MIDNKLMKTIDEVKYLSTENTWRYRPMQTAEFVLQGDVDIKSFL